MNSMKKLTFLLLVIVLFSSCAKEEDLKTNGQLIGEQIQQLMAEQHIHKIIIYHTGLMDGYTVEHVDEGATTFYNFDESVVLVGETYYNLDKLIKFWIEDRGNEKVMALYFQME